MDRIKYTNCWEDQQLLGEYLKVDSSSKVMSIASAGDNSLYLAAFQPNSILCIDMYSEQLYLSQLKEVCLRHLDRFEFCQFLGYYDSSASFRLGIYESLRHHLSLEAQNYFDEHINWLEAGIIHQGKFEKYFQFFSKKILPLIHTKARKLELVSPKSKNEQQKFYDQKWNNTRWEWLFKIFFGETVMSLLGRDPEKFNEVDVQVSQYIYEKTSSFFSEGQVSNNYMLDYILFSEFRTLPDFLEEKKYASIKSWLSKNEIQYENTDFLGALNNHPNTFNRFNLSNIFEYLSEDQFSENVEMLEQKMGVNTKVCFWNLMVKRELDSSKLKRNNVEDLDRGFFYNQFLNYSS